MLFLFCNVKMELRLRIRSVIEDKICEKVCCKYPQAKYHKPRKYMELRLGLKEIQTNYSMEMHSYST